MANNEYVNKVVLAGGNTLIDLTSDTAEQADVAYGKYFHLKSGQRVQGTSTKDSDTTDANASAGDIANGKTAYVNKVKIVGEMPIIGSEVLVIDDINDEPAISAGSMTAAGKQSLTPPKRRRLFPATSRAVLRSLA